MPDWTLLDDHLYRAIDAGQLAGAVIRVWARGAERHRAALGFADVAAGRAMADDAVFRLYSMTKPISAAAMMVLWDEGRWSPDDPVDAYLSELAELTVLQPDGTIRPAARAPTIEEVMTHRAGFAYGMGPEPVDMAFAATGLVGFPRAFEPGDFLARLAQAPLAYEPGEQWRYSVAMDVQGLIVERLSGMRYADFLQQHLFGPLGMTDTGFDLRPDQADRLVGLYAPFAESIVEVPTSWMSPDYAEPHRMGSGGAGLLSTAGDYLRFGRMLHGRGALDGVRVLSEAAFAEMTRSHTPAWMLDRGFGTAPHWLRPGYEYAYNGVVITDPAAAGVALGRGTYFWDGAAGTWFWTDPENDVVMVCMIQLHDDAERLGLQFGARAIVSDLARQLA